MANDKKQRKKSQRQLLIEALLNLDPDPSKQPKLNWKLEMRHLNSLLKRDSDMEFWFFLSRRRTFPTLIALLSSDGFIFKCQLEYTKQKNLELKTSQEVKLEQNKIGEDMIITRAQKTLFDFVNK